MEPSHKPPPTDSWKLIEFHGKIAPLDPARRESGKWRAVLPTDALYYERRPRKSERLPLRRAASQPCDGPWVLSTLNQLVLHVGVKSPFHFLTIRKNIFLWVEECQGLVASSIPQA